jgi:hypothetical protein
LLNNKYVSSPTPSIPNTPKIADTNLPATTGSETTLNTGIIDHINNGCLPSDKGKNRKEASALITWAQRTYMASSANTGSLFRLTNLNIKPNNKIMHAAA